MTVVDVDGLAPLVVLAFASYRLQRIVTRDSISASFRGWLWRKGYETRGYDSSTDLPGVVVRSWWWSKAFELADCPFCLGFWTSLGLYGAWRAWPGGWVHTAIIGVAVAGLQSFVSSRKDA